MARDSSAHLTSYRARNNMQYTWHWIFHSDTLQCDCGGVHYERSSDEIYTSVEGCITAALEHKPSGNSSVLVVKELHTIPAKIKFMENKMNRLKTFEHWPNRGKPTPQQLAENGFYFTGHFDGVECYSCGLRLKNWGPKDSPVEEHFKYNKKCQFNRQFLPADTLTRNTPMETSTPEIQRPSYDVTGPMEEMIASFSKMRIV